MTFQCDVTLYGNINETALINQDDVMYYIPKLEVHTPMRGYIYPILRINPILRCMYSVLPRLMRRQGAIYWGRARAYIRIHVILVGGSR